VERVVDGDTIRVSHLPGYNWRRWNAPAPLRSRGIADRTLLVRVYGVDCPELGKFGRPAQPYAGEARDCASRLVLHRVVRITLLRRDQYRRAIGRVETVPPRWLSWIPLPRFRPVDLSVELAGAGLAELYTGGGAEYCVRFCLPKSARYLLCLLAYRFPRVADCLSLGSSLLKKIATQDNRARLERRIERAKRKGRGMWALGDKHVSAAEYKRESRRGGAAPSLSASKPPIRRGRRSKVLDSVLTGLELAAG
jgi:endonuclease YncB( thermonuclease family)